jgi:protein-disulfide isomerase
MKMLKTLAISTVLVSAFINSAVAENVTKEELGGLIRQYLLDNPKVVIEAVENFQRQETQKEMEGVKSLIKANSAAIYANKTHGSIGDASAKVKIVEFFDYNCSACKYMFNSIDGLFKGGLKDVQVIFVEYPIFGESSKALSRIALAVNQLAPAKYFEFHSKMMKHKAKIEAADAYKYADEVGIKKEAIEKELQNPKYNEMLAANEKLGIDLKLRGTPFLIVGDEPIPSAVDESGLRDLVNKAKNK